ncbi:hypothetical protein GCM10009560_15050 [Nonomuraea longicatena]|uniref:Secreted protein n=1 Tax=Nonomuraea longicatena TaxID=83682 RepID=A0ABN1NWG5_9ACTN
MNACVSATTVQTGMAAAAAVSSVRVEALPRVMVVVMFPVPFVVLPIRRPGDVTGNAEAGIVRRRGYGRRFHWTGVGGQAVTRRADGA